MYGSAVWFLNTSRHLAVQPSSLDLPPSVTYHAHFASIIVCVSYRMNDWKEGVGTQTRSMMVVAWAKKDSIH